MESKPPNNRCHVWQNKTFFLMHVTIAFHLAILLSFFLLCPQGKSGRVDQLHIHISTPALYFQGRWLRRLTYSTHNEHRHLLEYSYIKYSLSGHWNWIKFNIVLLPKKCCSFAKVLPSYLYQWYFSPTLSLDLKWLRLLQWGSATSNVLSLHCLEFLPTACESMSKQGWTRVLWGPRFIQFGGSLASCRTSNFSHTGGQVPTWL